MSERKSSRARKTVKYAGFDDESDDDFADTRASKSKKMKTKEEEEGKKKSKERLTKINVGGILPSDEPSSIRKRKCLTDKLYEKELEEALQLSMLETSASESPLTNQEISSTSDPSSSNNMQVEVEIIHSKAPELMKVHDEDMQSEVKTNDEFDKEPPLLLPLNPSKIGTVIDDSIECVTDKEEDTKNRPRRQRKAAQKSIIIDNDDNSDAESDFNPRDNSDSDSNEDDEDEEDEEFSPNEDSDFDDHQKKKGKEKRKNAVVTKKSNPLPKNNKPAKRNAQKNLEKEKQDMKKPVANSKTPMSTSGRKDSHPIIKSTQVLSPLSSTTAMMSTPTVSLKRMTPALSSPVTSIQRSAERLSQCWKAPGPASKDNNASPMVRSPSSGLRLGLSRNQRVKSLHSSVKVL